MIIFILVLLQIKHFVADFLLQKPYQYLNKGTYGHPGGLLHSAIQGWATSLVFAFSAHYGFALAAGLADAIIHYHIDWAKVKINKKYGWKADTSEKFWWLLGFDQLLHQLTYLGIVAYAATRGII